MDIYSVNSGTYVLVAAITVFTVGSRSKFIHIEVATVADLNVVFPLTAVVLPVVTHFTSHYQLINPWVFTIEPASS